MTATAMETDHLVRAVNVTKAFGSNEVLKGIDLNVDAKEVVCLLGPSGSGKTTFLRLINQMEILTGGRIWVGGELIGNIDRLMQEGPGALQAPITAMRGLAAAHDGDRVAARMHLSAASDELLLDVNAWYVSDSH